MIELILKFGIGVSKAYELVTDRTNAVKFQLEVWPHRQVAPRNRAGWMIQAIENNYVAPSLYLEHRREQKERETVAAVQAALRDCAICDNSGFRYIKSSKYPNGAMRQCSHNALVESEYSDLELTEPTPGDALDGSIRGEKTEDDKRPAEDSASL